MDPFFCCNESNFFRGTGFLEKEWIFLFERVGKLYLYFEKCPFLSTTKFERCVGFFFSLGELSILVTVFAVHANTGTLNLTRNTITIE